MTNEDNGRDSIQLVHDFAKVGDMVCLRDTLSTMTGFVMVEEI